MRWSDEGLYLSGRPFGEISVIADIFTRNHGRTLGLIKGGRSRRLRPLLQTGNILAVEWRARLDEQLGVYTAEMADAAASRLIDDALSLKAVLALAALLETLPERDPYPRLYDAAKAYVLKAQPDRLGEEMVYFELKLLDEMGFGLVLSRCAATGGTRGLLYVSPKSGQAVSEEAGAPYKDRLLPLPAFLTGEKGRLSPSAAAISDAFCLTGHFLDLHVFGQHAKSLPRARKDFIAALHDRNKTKAMAPEPTAH